MARITDSGALLLTLRRSSETAGAAFQAFERIRAIVDANMSTLATSLNSGAPAMSLPLDLLSDVVLSLDLTTDRLAATGVCRQWREHLLHDSRIWQPLKWTFGGATIRQEAQNMQKFKDDQIRSLRGDNTVTLVCRITTGTLPLNVSSAEFPLDRLSRLSLDVFAPCFGFAISPCPNLTSLHMHGRYGWPQLVEYLFVNLDALFPMLRILVVDTDFAQFGEQFVPAVCHGLAVCFMYGPVLDNRTWRILRTAYPNLTQMDFTVDYIGAIESTLTEKEAWNLKALEMKGYGSQEVLNFDPFARILVVSIEIDLEHWSTPPWRLLEQIRDPDAVTVQTLRDSNDPAAREKLLVRVDTAGDNHRIRNVILRGAGSDHAHTVPDALIAHVLSGVRTLRLDLSFAEAILCKAYSAFGSVTKLALFISQPGATFWPCPNDAAVVLPSLANVIICTYRTRRRDRICAPVAEIKCVLQRLRAPEDGVLPKPRLILEHPVYVDDVSVPELQAFVSSILTRSVHDDEVQWVEPDPGSFVPGI